MESINVWGRHPILSHNRAVGLKLLLGAMALSLAAGVEAQPAGSFMLDTSVVVGRDYATAWATASGFVDSIGLVIWVGGTLGAIEGCRVSGDMNIIDSVCLDISGPDFEYASTQELHAVDVAASRQRFLVVWLGDSGICGSLVSTQGEVIRRVVICDPESVRGWVSVASDGGGFMVTWEQDSGESTREMYRLVSEEGVPIGGAHRLSMSGGNQCNGDLDYGDGCYLVAFWRNDTQGGNVGLSVVRVRTDGALEDSVPVPLRECAMTAAPSVGHFSDNFYVAWGEGQDSMDLRIARVTSGGMVMDSGGVVVGRDSMIVGLSSAAGRDTCILAWISCAGETGFVRTRRVDADVHVLDSASLCVSSAKWAPLAPDGVSASVSADFDVVWCQLQTTQTSDGNQRDVVCRRVSSVGVLVDSADRVLSCAANTQLGSDVASDGQDFLALWQSWSGFPLTPHLQMARFSSGGHELDSLATPVGDSGACYGTLAYGADRYLACWFQPATEEIEAVRVGRDGIVLDTTPIVIGALTSKPDNVDIAYGDGEFLVVWNDGSGGIYGARVTPDGSVLDSSPKPMGHGGTFCFNPFTASDGCDFLVTYHKYYARKLFAARVDSAGLLMDSTDLTLAKVTLYPISYVPVAFGAGVYTAYDCERSRTWRVSRNGEVLDSITGLGIGGDFVRGPTISFDGMDFLVGGYTGGSGMSGQRISPSGVLLDPNPFTLATINHGGIPGTQ